MKQRHSPQLKQEKEITILVLVRSWIEHMLTAYRDAPPITQNMLELIPTYH